MRLTGIQNKGWGYENILVTTDDYCAKMLVFTKPGARCSMHFHTQKDETWLVHEGVFEVVKIDTATGAQRTIRLKEGDAYRNLPLEPHQLIALTTPAIIFEVSTPDSVEDNYRVAAGDTQSQ